jgi:hypothetical protein
MSKIDKTARLNTHESSDRPEEVQTASDRSFGILFSVVFLILGLWPLRHGMPVRTWMLVVSVALLLVALVLPRVLHPANIVWSRIGMLLHKVVNPLVTGLLFYLVFTPVGILLRMFGKDVLKLEKHAGDTYWIVRTPASSDPGSMTRQF